MAQTSIQVMAQALWKAGFKGDAITTMIAIALGESGGDPTSICDSCLGVDEYSVGLWQINLHAHPDVTKECALDPYCAAKAAYQISNQGTSFTPWTQYTNGGYTHYLDQVKAVITSPINSANDLVQTINDSDLLAALKKADTSLLNAIGDALPPPFNTIGSLLGIAGGFTFDFFVSHVPTWATRKALSLLPEDKLTSFLQLIPSLSDIAGVVTDPIGAVSDAFSSVWGFAMPSTDKIMHVLGVGLLVVTGVGLVFIGGIGTVWKVPGVKTVANTAAGVGAAVATGGESTTVKGGVKAIARRQARTRAVAKRAQTRAAARRQTAAP